MIDSAIYICTTGCAELQEDGKQGHCITTGERYRETLDRLARADYCPCGNKENWIPIGDYIADLETELNRHSESEGLLLHKIEHGGKRDVDVAALRELADDMDKRAHGAYGKTFVNASMYAGLMHGLSKRIRKAVEGATVPDAESEAERACAALLEWRDQVAGMLGIDGGSMADEVQDAIMAELDKRLMPPGMTWPRFEDGEHVMMGDEILTHINQASNVTSVRFNEYGSFVCYKWGGRIDGANVSGSDAKRPEPEALGADGEPIKVGETVYDRLGGTFYVFEITHGGIETTCGYLSASEVTHTPPDTQERIDDDATMPPREYCRTRDLEIEEEPRVGYYETSAVETMVADLLSRQRELDAKTMGGE